VTPARVEPGERLVEYEQLGIVDERDGELRTLLIAVRERVDPRLLPAGQPEAGDPVASGPSGGGAAHAVQPREVLHLVGQFHGRVQTTLFRHIAEGAAGRLVDRAVAPADLAGVQRRHAEDGAHGGGLSRAVRPEEAEHLPGRYAEAEAVERGDRSVRTTQPVDL
jgi:hypothetical protein